ncbi:Slam-dependent surface lipoprotein [Psychrobacter sp. Cmf 22.2]|uniref:Slam-dependent surface lipoprotein n=2 Tax=unclassified Psychrobacter TaxID=196806 RepID=UPI000AEA901D|nr:Slam-dependent surface lipoprotein [Psychrobacter sp. Cmf 22.2]
MNLKYLSRASLLAVVTVSIIACSSSGSNNFSDPSTKLPPIVEQTEAEKAEAERLKNIETNRLELLAAAKTAGLTDQQAAAYAEANKEANATDAQSTLNTLVAEKIAAEKAEADRIAAEKAAAEKAAAEKAAAEKAAAEKAAAEKAAAEKAASEKAASEKAAAEKAAAEKAAAEKAAAEKAAAEKAASEKAAAEKAEKERLQKIEANRVALLAAAKTAGLTDQQAAAYAEANKEASETEAESALDTLVAEKIAAEKAEADRIAAEKAEAERLQKIEANRVALLAAAKTAGLTDQQAAAYAEANKEASETDAQSALNTIIKENTEKALRAEASAAKGISDNVYPVGAITANTSASSSSTRNAFTQESRIQTVVYNQPYSVVLGNYSGELSYNNQTGAIITDERDSNITIRGLKTASDAIPTLGNATYTGKAFNGTYKTETNIDYSGSFPSITTSKNIKEGALSYNVNFTNRTGAGSITGLGDTVDLQQGTISGTGINSTVEQGLRNGSYSLDFFGKKAEEIAGKVVFDGKDTIGFGGTRGEISK